MAQPREEAANGRDSGATTASEKRVAEDARDAPSAKCRAGLRQPPEAQLFVAVPGPFAPASAAKSAPTRHPSCHLHSADLLADTAPERFQSTFCVPLAV